MNSAPQALADEIRSGRRTGLDDADLRGVDLRRVELSCVAMRRAKLDGAQLDEAVFECVDLTHASFEGASLERTHLERCKATRAKLARAHGNRAVIDGVDLSYADLSDTNLEQVFFRNTTLEKANLDRAMLVEGKIAHCNANGATFRDADLFKVLTVGSTFFTADLTGARRFFLSREIVAEILSREVEDDFERSRLVGVVAINPKFCFREWKAWLEFHPDLLAEALSVFAKHPASGCREALLEGYAGPTLDGPI